MSGIRMFKRFAGIHVWDVPVFGRTFESHKVVITMFAALFGGIGYAVFKPKNYDVKKYVESLPKEKQQILKEKHVKIE